MPLPPPAQAVIWTDHNRLPVTAQILKLLSGWLEPTAIGGPPEANLLEYAGQIGSVTGNDLRTLLIDRPAQFIVLTSMAGVRLEDIHTATAKGVCVLTTEPVAATIDDLIEPTSGKHNELSSTAPSSGRVVLVPGFRQSCGWWSAANPGELLGKPRSINVISCGPDLECSLFARLLDAWKLVLELVGLPDAIDASLSGIQPSVNDNLRTLRGFLTTHARFAGQCTVVMQIGCVEGPTRRIVRAISENAHLAVDDSSYELFDRSGVVVDQLQPKTTPPGFAELTALAIRRILDSSTELTESSGSDLSTQALACCLACLLSTRTAQSESPASILKMGR